MKSFLAATVIVLCLANGFYVGETRGQNETINFETQNILQKNVQMKKVVLNGTLKDVQQLLSDGFEVNKDYACSSMLNTGIQSLFFNENPKALPDEALQKIRILIEFGADVNMESCKMTPLVIAVTIPAQMRELEMKYYETIDIKADSSSDICNVDGISKPCKETTQEERKQMKADIHKIFVEEQKKIEPFILEIINILLNAGADVNKKSGGITPIHFANNTPKDGSLEIMKHLIAKGADVNSTDFRGNTPLFVANFASNNEAINLLIKAGADTKIRNNKGELYYTFKPGEFYNSYQVIKN